jgi:hypothetical protein
MNTEQPRSWDEMTWTETPMESNFSVNHVLGVRRNDAWAVVFSSGFRTAYFYREHWNGSQWTHTVDEGGGDLFTPDSIVAFDQTAIGTQEKGGLMQYRADRWKVWAGSPHCSLVTGTSDEDVWCGDGLNLHHWDGMFWTSVQLAGCIGLQATAADDVWAWTSSSVVHWDGFVWSTQAAFNVRALAASARDDVWILTAEDHLLHSAGAGSSWIETAVGEGPPTPLYGIWARTRDDAWAVGTSGLILRWNGEKWSALTPVLTENSLNSVSGSGADVWIGGDDILFHGVPSGL